MSFMTGDNPALNVSREPWPSPRARLREQGAGVCEIGEPCSYDDPETDQQPVSEVPRGE